MPLLIDAQGKTRIVEPCWNIEEEPPPMMMRLEEAAFYRGAGALGACLIYESREEVF